MSVEELKKPEIVKVQKSKLQETIKNVDQCIEIVRKGKPKK